MPFSSQQYVLNKTVYTVGLSAGRKSEDWHVIVIMARSAARSAV